MNIKETEFQKKIFFSIVNFKFCFLFKSMCELKDVNIYREEKLIIRINVVYGKEL